MKLLVLRNAIWSFCLLVAGLFAPVSQGAVSVTVTNFSFEQGNNPGSSPLTPNGTDSEQFDGMMTETPNSPTNWTFAYEVNAPAAGNGLWGVVIPRASGTGNNNFYGSKPGFNGVTSLPGTFEGIQLAFINLNNTNSPPGPTVARADSGIVGVLQPGTYTLTVAVGARSTTSWPNIDYSIGLVTAGGTELGTFTHQVMDPDNAAGNNPIFPAATDQVNIADVTYTLTVEADDPVVGQNYFIRIRAANTGVGGTGGFTQANFDNVRLNADVQSAPTITGHPQGTNVFEGGTVRLSVAASGTPPFSYTWFKEDTQIPDETNSMLVLSNVALSDGGSYRVAVSNEFGGLVSDSAIVNVEPTELPTITEHPESLAGYPGRDVKFQVAATGAAQFTYQWQHDEMNIPAGTNSMLFLTNIQAADSGGYRAIVTDSAGSATSMVATLTVIVPTAGSYEAALVNTGPIGYWRLGEATGSTAFDYSGGNHGTYNTVLQGVEGALTNDADFAAEFVNASSVTTMRSLLSDRQAFTLTGWIFLLTTQNNRTGLFGQNDAVEFGLINPTNIQVFTAGGGSLSVPYSLPNETWHHIAAVGTGTNLSIYFNGTRRGTGGTVTGSYGTSSFGFNIGGGGIFDDTGNFFNGVIDEVSVHDRALTSDEICGLYLTGSGAPLTLAIAKSSNGVTLLWPCGTLQCTDEFSSPESSIVWTDIPTAASPYTITNMAPMRFYRVRR